MRPKRAVSKVDGALTYFCDLVKKRMWVDGFPCQYVIHGDRDLAQVACFYNEEETEEFLEFLGLYVEVVARQQRVKAVTCAGTVQLRSRYVLIPRFAGKKARGTPPHPPLLAGTFRGNVKPCAVTMREVLSSIEPPF